MDQLVLVDSEATPILPEDPSGESGQRPWLLPQSQLHRAMLVAFVAYLLLVLVIVAAPRATSGSRHSTRSHVLRHHHRHSATVADSAATADTASR